MELKFEDFNKKYIPELNGWQEEEHSRGQSGIADYVGDSEVLLGDYLDYVASEMGIETKIVLSEDRAVGFVSYVKKKGNEIYIEIIGVSPHERGKNLSEKIMAQLKELAGDSEKYKVTFRVKNTNAGGLKSFSRFARKNEGLTSGDYFGFEL